MMGMGNPFYVLQRIWRGRKAPVALLLVFFVAFIWWIGPKLPYPFNNVVVRGFIIIGLLAVIGAVTAWRRRKKNKNADALVSAVVEPDESEILKKRFKSAINTLKASKKAGRKGIMDLPWYIIIGPPGSGKTTLLRNAGLNFPIEGESGAAAVKGVGGTRDCDWWFADQAVLLDTAGRYTTQDSDETTDRKAWLAFLDLLRGRRKKRPINGILVAIGADILQAQSTEAIEVHAQTIRKRVLELYTRLKGRFPIYLLITKIDLVPGFTEFFEDLNAAEREQVWGYTQQIIKNTGEEAQIDATFDGEFDALLSRLATQTLDRIRDEPDPARRALILGFPEQMARARKSMRTLVTHGFSPNAYQERLLLRGLYMTSGTQEGAPIDRLMGGLAKAMKINPQVSRITQPTGRSFFIKDMLSRVAFREQDLLGIGYRQAQRRRKIQIGSYIGFVSLAALAMIGWTYIYYQERDYVETATQTLEDYDRNKRPITTGPMEFGDQAREVVVFLDDLRRAREDVADADPGDTMFGLPGDDALLGSVDKAYNAQLDKVLAPMVEESLRTRLQRREDMMQEITAFNPFEVNLMATFVRAYGALESPRERMKTDEDKAAVYDAIMYDFTLRNPSLARDLQSHVYAWIYKPRGPASRSIKLGALDGARANLAAGGDGLGQVRSAYADWLFKNLYRIEDSVADIQSQDSDAVTLVAPGLVNQIGLGANDVFRRQSGRDLNEPIPFIFTRAGFIKFFATDQDNILDSVEQRSWVYPPTPTTQRLNKGDAKRAVTRAYVNDYIQFWRDLMADVVIKQSNRKDVLREIWRRPSPLKDYLKIITTNTQLVKKEDESDKKRRRRLPKRDNADNAPLTPQEQVTLAFADIAELLGTEESPGKIEEILNNIKTLADGMADIEMGRQPVGMDQASRALETLARDMEGGGTSFDYVLRDILGTAEDANTKNSVNQLNDIYRQSVLGTCTGKISQRYPFSASSSGKVTPQDLEDVFGAQGVMTQFIDQHLSPYIDRTRGTWTWRPEARELAGNSGSLLQFQRADRINKAFFRRGSAGFEFKVKPLTLVPPTQRAELAIGSQVVDFYREDTPIKGGLKWPSDLASLTLYSPDRPETILTANGDWSLFRLLDQATRIQVSSDKTSNEVTFQDAELSAVFRFDMDSVDNPISNFSSWRNFRCPRKVW